MDALHRFFNEIIGAEGVSEQLYSLLGHGRWVNLFIKLTTAHAIVNAPEGAKP